MAEERRFLGVSEFICCVRGGDFATARLKDQLDWFKVQLEKKYEPKGNCRLGSGADANEEGKIVNRIVGWTDEGLEYEADPRQSEKIIEELGLEGAKDVSTPAVKASLERVEGDYHPDPSNINPYPTPLMLTHPYHPHPHHQQHPLPLSSLSF